MTRTSTEDVVSGRADSASSSAALVTHHLDQLGIGQHWVQTGEQGDLRIIDRQIPAGLGWCRATDLYRALWPAGAELCAQVEWHADQDVPAAEQAEHWRTRLAAVTAALESVGYAVRAPGPRRTPGVDRYQPLIASRPQPGSAQPAVCPIHGWDHVPVHPVYEYPEPNPREVLAAKLDTHGLTHRYSVRSLDTHLWPPYATAAMVVTWASPRTALVMDWDSAMARARRLLRALGYGVMDHGRIWDPAVDREPYLIAYVRGGLR